MGPAALSQSDTTLVGPAALSRSDTDTSPLNGRAIERPISALCPVRIMPNRNKHLSPETPNRLFAGGESRRTDLSLCRKLLPPACGPGCPQPGQLPLLRRTATSNPLASRTTLVGSGTAVSAGLMASTGDESSKML